MNSLRSTLYTLAQIVLTPFYFLLMWVSSPFGLTGPRYFSRLWCRTMLMLGQWICGIRYEIHGWENIPKEACITLVKHQSTWETFFFPAYFPPHSFVLKKELLKVPFFGWGLSVLNPIPIDRSQKKVAFQQVQREGKKRLQQGTHIVLFPEGTRIPFGFRGRYAQSGALLALSAQAPILPITHNAGQYWPKNGAKMPGTIQFIIGPLMYPEADETAAHLSHRAENWIEEQLEQLTGQKALPYTPTKKS